MLAWRVGAILCEIRIVELLSQSKLEVHSKSHFADLLSFVTAGHLASLSTSDMKVIGSERCVRGTEAPPIPPMLETIR